MALIKCTECGQNVSDKAEKCPNCGVSIAEMQMYEQQKADISNDTQKSIPTTEKKKSKLPIIIAIIAGVLIVSAIILVVVLCGFSKLNVDIIEMKKWKLTDSMSYGSIYEATVTSEQTKPFVAVIGSYDAEENAVSFVYMEEGKGTFETYASEEEDPSIEYKPTGYLSGYSITEDDLKSIEYDDSDYYDWSYNETTSCSIDIEAVMKKKLSGLFFYELSNDTTNDIDLWYTAVTDGNIDTSYYLDEIPYKSRGVEGIVVPKYFCECKLLNEKDYIIEKELTFEKNDDKYYTSYSGEMELSFTNYDDGIIIYSEELTEGGDKENRGEVISSWVILKDGKCSITTYDSDDAENKMLAPQYDINIIGYIPINRIGEDT